MDLLLEAILGKIKEHHADPTQVDPDHMMSRMKWYGCREKKIDVPKTKPQIHLADLYFLYWTSLNPKSGNIIHLGLMVSGMDNPLVRELVAEMQRRGVETNAQIAESIYEKILSVPIPKYPDYFFKESIEIGTELHARLLAGDLDDEDKQNYVQALSFVSGPPYPKSEQTLSLAVLTCKPMMDNFTDEVKEVVCKRVGLSFETYKADRAKFDEQVMTKIREIRF